MLGVRERAARTAACALLLAAAAQYAWNGLHVPPLAGYDAPGHAAYILFILEQRRLPHPLSGWSTFHPPAYYLLGALVWRLFEPLGAQAIVAALRAISSLSTLVMGAIAYVLVRRDCGRASVAWVAAAVLLFVPCVQMAAVSIGNEALGAGLAALTVPFLLRLQRRPDDAWAAAGAAFFAAAALVTKYNGTFVAAACAVPFLRRDLDRAALRALAVAIIVAVAVAGPVYVRNLVVTGTLVPLTREIEPMKSAEAANVIRERRVSDYLWFDPACLLRPSIRTTAAGGSDLANVPGESTVPVNTAMSNIWGLAYASTWYDAFVMRIPLSAHRDGVIAGPLLTLLGLVPTSAMIAGFLLSLRESMRTRLRSPASPLVIMWIFGFVGFLAFTVHAPSAAAVKSSYLLPLAVPGAVFFGRALRAAGARLRSAILVVSTTAAMAAALVFTSGLVFPPQPDNLIVGRWRLIAHFLPQAPIPDVLDRLVVPARPPSGPR